MAKNLVGPKDFSDSGLLPEFVAKIALVFLLTELGTGQILSLVVTLHSQTNCTEEFLTRKRVLLVEISGKLRGAGDVKSAERRASAQEGLAGGV